MDENYVKEVSALIERYKAADGSFIKLANYAGSQFENVLSKIPDEFEEHLQNAVMALLSAAYEASGTISNASISQSVSSYFHKITVIFSGAIGGATGLPGALAELPITITTMFSSFQKIATQYGFDPDDAETKMECINIFSMGGPLDIDDDNELSFITARLGLQGEIISKLIAKTAEKFLVKLSQKLISQTVPVLGAVTGATLNSTFMSYYEEMAHVRFGLKKLQLKHPNINLIQDFVRRCNKPSVA